MINIITDSTADLTAEIIARHRLRVVPLMVTIAGQTFRDGDGIGPGELFRLVDETGQLPKTAAPTIPDFASAFAAADESIYIGISSQLSAAVNNAMLASQACDGRVRVIDSLNLSTGIGLLALYAAELRDAGAGAAAIEQAVVAAIPKIRTSFVIDTLRYLTMGGRCTALQNIVGSVLKIRPVIEVRGDGTLGIKEKVRGPRRRALQTLLDDYASHAAELDRRRVFVTHTGCQADAEYLQQELARIARPDEILITTAGSVIASHCGPDTIGVLYRVK